MMERGSAVTDGRFAYFAILCSNSLYQYEYSMEIWTELPPCPYRESGLVIIDGELTTVGGWDANGKSRTEKLFTLREGVWVEEYPPIDTARSYPGVVSTSDGNYFIVIGGYEGYRWNTTVELFEVKSRKWHKLTDLPQTLHYPSLTICGDQLNVIGVGDSDGYGYSCSLQALPSSGRAITSPLTLSWKPLPRVPVTWSTPATLCGQLVIIGGWRFRFPDSSILQLVDGEWVRIGFMTNSRHYCLVANPSPDRIIIVGGRNAQGHVEECAVVY